MNYRLYKFLFFTLILAAFGCSDNETLPADPGYDFFPVNQNARVYQVQEINFNALGSDTSDYQLREFISDSLTSESGDVTYILTRQIRNHEDESWQTDSLWNFRKEVNRVVVTENNLPFIKLIFPVRLGLSWNGNAYNTLSRQTYTYQSANSVNLQTPYVADDMMMVVISDVEANLVNQDQRYEIYSRGLGLLEKQYIQLEFCTVNCDGSGQINSGRILRQYLIQYDEN